MSLLATCHALTVAAALGGGWGCTHASRASTDARPAVQAGEDRIQTLKRAHPEAQIQTDGSGQRVRRITGMFAPATPGGTAQSIAASVLKEGSVVGALGLSPDLRELCRPVTRDDPQLPGNSVIRWQQCAKDIRVVGAELVMNVQTTPQARINLLSSNLASSIPERLTPSITAEEGRSAAEASLKNLRSSPGFPKRGGELTMTRAPELVVFDPQIFGLQGPTRLCWLVSLSQIATLVDAATKAVVHQYSEAIRSGAVDVQP